MVGVVNVALLACVLRTTTKKGRKLSEKEKVHPEKILATDTRRLVWKRVAKHLQSETNS